MDTTEHGGNILKTDVELSALIRRLDNINKYKSFQKWKTKFLDRLDQFLYEAGKDPAQKASEKFDLSLQKNVKQLNKVQDCMSKGDLSETKKSVKASLALQELCNKLTVLNDEIETIIPKSRAEEKQRGFTKFNLGAVLIQEGFPQYAKMEVIRDAVIDIGNKLENVADRQQLDLFFYYRRQVDRFCDVMADLNLYEIMKKCIEFATAPEIEESSSEEEPMLINVVIETYDGKTMRLELDPLENVGNIKAAIAPGSGIEADEQILQFNGETLNDDESTLEQAGVQDGSTLWLEPRNITVQVEMPGGGASHPLKVALSDQKIDIQKRIEVQLPGKIAVDQQVLTYKDDQEYPDDNGQTVKQLKLQNGDVLKVSIKLIQVAIETYDGKTMNLELDPTESIGNVQDAIAPGSGIESDEQVLQFQNETLMDPDESLQGVGIVDGSTLWLEPRNITVQVEMPDGTTHGLKLSLQDKPIDIRKKIQVQIPPNIPTDEQVVTYKSEELLEDDSRTVKEMKMQNDDILNVRLLEFPITVRNTMDGTEYEIMVNPKKPLSVIKNLLEEKSGIPVANQNLFTDSTSTLLDSEEDGDGTKPAEEYGIVDGTILDLEPKKIQINVDMPDGTRQSIDLSPRDDTSDDIKKKIEEKTGMVVRRQVLSHKGNEIPADDSTTNIKDLGIRDGDDIKVDIYKIPISVTTMDGKQIDIEIDPTEPIGTEIKKQIVDESDVPADNQRLFRNREDETEQEEEEDLDDDGKTAEDYTIEAGAALNMEPKIIKVNVEMVADGSKHVVDLTPRDTNEVIKKKIEEKTGLPPKKQVVSYKGEELPTDDSTTNVKEMGIREGDDLKVSIFKIPITVKTMDGKKIKVMIDPAEPIADIKKQIAEESGVPPDNQRLFANEGEEELDDAKTPEDYGIQADAELDMEPKTIHVNVEMPDGSTHVIDLTPNDTTDDIKQKIEEKTGMIAPRQVVKHKLLDEELPSDGSTVKQMGINEGDALVVEIFKIPITVTTMDGKKIDSMIDPTEPISEIKKQIADESGVPADNQRFYMNGEELDDDSKPAQDYGIEAGTNLDMEPKIIKVNVEMPDGETHAIELTPKDTSDDIKAKIEKATGMIAPRQVVTHNGNELPADSESTVKDMGIREGDDLKVDIYKIPITVNTMDGKTIEVMFDPTEPVGNIKKQIEDESGVPADNQRLFMNNGEDEMEDDTKSAKDYAIEPGTVLDMEPKIINVNVEMPDGTTHAVALTPRDTSEDIKAKIEKETGMIPERQVLKHKLLGEELPQETSVKDMGIKEGDDLAVGIFKIPIAVNTMDGQRIELMIDPTEPTGEIKKMVEAESGVPASNQRLSMNGEELADDAKPAKEYGVEAGAELDMEPKIIKVNVEMPDGTTQTIELTPKDTSDDIKAKIEKATGMIVPRQVVKFHGNELPQDGSTVKDIGIREGDDLKVEIFKIPISVTTIDGEKIEAIIDPTEPLGEIKKQIANEAGVPADNQRIFMNGEELDDDSKPAKDYGIEAGTDLDMEPKVIKVNVTMPDGEIHSVDLTPKDSTEDIKKKIEEKTGMIVPRQVLKHQGNELPQDGTVKDMGIREGDDLDVEIFKIPVVVNTMDGKTIEAVIDPTEPIGELKEQIAAESGVPAENQRLFMNGEELDDDAKPAQDYGIVAGSELDMEPKTIKINVAMPDGQTKVVEITPSDTSDVIKEKIAKETGMEPPRQVLKHKGNELPKDQTTAKDMGLREGDDLDVGILKIPVTVNTYDGKVIEIMIEPTDTIGQIKEQLQEPSGIQPSNQRLSRDDDVFDDDIKKANDCGIVSGSVLDLEPKSMTVSVTMPNGEKHNVDIEPRDTPAKIKKRIEDGTGMEVPRQVLKFNGEEIPKGKTVMEAGIMPGDNLDVEIFKIPVTVNMMDGKSFEILVDPYDNLGTVKSQIEQESGLLPSNQRVFLKKTELENDTNTAKSYGIVSGSVLDVEPRFLNVNVAMPDGTKHTIRLTPNDKEGRVKEKIEEESGMAVRRQIVKFNDKVLPGFDHTVRDMGIQEGSELKVSIIKIPITVKTDENKIIPFEVEPIDTIETLKIMIEKETGMAPSKQVLKKGDTKLVMLVKTVEEYGIEENNQLTLEPHLDPIIFVDIKSESLFAVDRDEVVKRGILTPNQGNKLDFNETVRDSKKKDELGKIMKDAPLLGVAVQLVVQGLEVDDYDVDDKVINNKWGVTLKKRSKNKKGEELIFVDPKTGSVGELQRKKAVEDGFITPTDPPKGKRAATERREFIKESETNQLKYDEYRDHIREIYGIALK